MTRMPMSDDLRWREEPFAKLTPAELYAICALRQRVFVVEQNCVFVDADGYDPLARHLWAEGEGAVRAYLRIVPAGLKFAEVSLGRVVTAPEARGTGLGRELMRRGLASVGALPVRIGAQAHLEKFYGELGFLRASEPYDEDGIPHVEMMRAAPTPTPG